MNKKEFTKLIDNTKYQVFLFSSPVPIPLNFSVHTTFVINLKGKISRWEFGKFRRTPHNNGIGVLKNFFENTEGMNIYFWKANPRFKSKLIDFIEGDDDSVTNKIAFFIDEFSNSYPLKTEYFMTGPNSNSYMQWILNKFPEAKLKLPLNAIGKGYNIT
ncbi:MAG: DUF3750 domain-containing protein [Melioribacteraceae bacterium]|nr:DUF3750 domain-containing protein [Melioribacteraceae bacterium]